MTLYSGADAPAGRPQRWWPKRSDAGTVLIVAVIDLFIFIGIAGEGHRLRLLAVAAAGYLPLLWRRRYPMQVFGLVWLHALTCAYLFPTLRPTVSLLVALFAVAARSDVKTATVTLVTALLVAPLAAANGEIAQTPDGDPIRIAITIGLFSAALVFASWALGRWARRSRTRIIDLERISAAAAAAARAEERRLIALELHDIVSHAVSVMVLQADGARAVLRDNPGRAEAAMEHISEVGRDSVGELRRLLGVLRADGLSQMETRPQARLRDIPLVVEEARRSGLSVSLETVGTAPTLPASFELSVHRIVQECLTNCLKHSGPATQVQIVFTWTAEVLVVTILDDGAGHRSNPELSSGHGLQGLRERARSLGGRLEAGARGDAPGYLVTVTVPLTPAPSSAET